MKDWIKFGCMFAALIALVAGCIWIKCNNYNECREHFSALYCLTAGGK